MSIVTATCTTCTSTISYSSALNQRWMRFVAGICKVDACFLALHIIQSMIASPATCKYIMHVQVNTYIHTYIHMYLFENLPMRSNIKT